MYSIPFYKLSPSKNMTLLFEGLNYSLDERVYLASQGLLPEHIGAEQAGFVDIDNGILQMAGGEFCINATRCLALLMALKAHKGLAGQSLQINENFKPWEGAIKTSGVDMPLTVQVQKIDNDAMNYNVRLNVPLSEVPSMQELDAGVVLVNLPGISHLLIDEKNVPFDANKWLEQAASMREKYNLEQEVAVGCIWWHSFGDCEQGVKELYMHPIVRVKEPWTLNYENACGSGALALGIWQQKKLGCATYLMRQPGGYLTLELQEDINGLKAVVGGPVHLLAHGLAYFNALLTR